MSNDLHRALEWGITATLQLSKYVNNVDNKPGLITKGAELIQIMYVFWLMHPYVYYVSSFLPSAPKYPWE
jgi:hypothetical protein